MQKNKNPRNHRMGLKDRFAALLNTRLESWFVERMEVGEFPDSLTRSRQVVLCGARRKLYGRFNSEPGGLVLSDND